MRADPSGTGVRRKGFDLRGEVPCAQEEGEALGVGTAAWGSGSDAHVVVTFGNGFAQTLRFEAGSFVSANTTISGNGTDIDWRLEDGVHVIRVDGQRFDVPQSLISGE